MESLPEAVDRRHPSLSAVRQCALLDITLTLEALKMAIARRSSTVIHHSDQGVQYASGDYVEELKNHGFLVSMARAGNPYENARMESFLRY